MPDMYRITLGSLSLSLPEKIRMAKDLLNSLNLRQVLGKLRTMRQVPEDSRADESLKVSLTGFEDYVQRSPLHNANSLHAKIIDEEGILS